MRKRRKSTLLTWSIVILVFQYLLAVFVLSKSIDGIFVFLAVPSLVVTAIALGANHIGESQKLITHFIVFSIVFYILEVIQLKMDLFGKSYANDLLGTSFLNVPFVMGVNGWISVYMGVHLVKKLKINRLKKAIVGATLLVILAALADPVGVKLGLWKYQNEFNPLNLLGYFVVYFLMIYFSRLIRFKKKNPIAGAVFLIFILFFISLNLIL